jgi:hypothetical protein
MAGGKTIWSVVVIAALGTGIIGVRTERSVTMVLSLDQLARVLTDPGSITMNGQSPDSTEEGDANLEESSRDPFEFFKIERKKTPRRNRPAPKRPEPVPTLTALLFDTVEPGVQLTLGDTRSQWLHHGDEFQGWRVAEIHETSATVTKGERTLVLRSNQERR